MSYSAAFNCGAHKGECQWKRFMPGLAMVAFVAVAIYILAPVFRE